MLTCFTFALLQIYPFFMIYHFDKDVGTEELAHLEMVGTMLWQLRE